MFVATGRATVRKSRVRFSWLAGPALLFVICAGFYWKLILTDQYSWIDSPDLVYMEVPRFQFQMSQWHQGHFPLWDPHQWCGQPLLGQIVGAAYPLNWPLFLLPFDANGKIRMSQLNWYFVLIHFLGALFCYWLCRDLGRSRIASIAGGLLFPLSGFFGIYNWPEVMGGLLFTPLVFLFLLRAVRGREPAASAALSGMFLGIAWLSGHHEIPVYISVTAGAVWVFYAVRSGKPDRKLLSLAALSFVIAALTGAFQILPGYEYGQLARRWVGLDSPVGWKEPVPYFIHKGFSFRPGSLVGIFIPWTTGDANIFIGVAGACLVLLGVLRKWKEAGARLFAVMALLTLLFSMAAYNIFHGLLYALIPIFEKARVPARILSLFDFAAAPLAAYGFDALREGAHWPGLRRLIAALAAFGALVYGSVLAVAAVRNYATNDYVMFSGMMALLVAGLFAAWRKDIFGEKTLAAGVLFLLLAELGVVSGEFPNRFDKNRTSFLPKLSESAEIARYLSQQEQPLRVDFNDEGNALNFGDWEGADVLQGFAAGVTSNLLALELHTPRTQDLMGVRYTIARKPMRPDQRLVYEAAGGLNVYWNPNAFPRAWAVHEVVPYKDDDQLREMLRDVNFDLSSRAPLAGTLPSLDACGGEEPVSVVSYRAGGVSVDAVMRCAGMVVLSDTWYPGWFASVDGKPAPIYEPYGALRGVVVGPGTHRIEMRFRPRSVFAGAFLSLLGIIGACGLALIAWKRERTTPS